MIRLDMLGALVLQGPDRRELRSLLVQPKRLALLAYLAVESVDGFQRRDRLLALFWPELDQVQARQALRQSLYVLRRSLGDDVLINRGAEEVGIARGALQCDVCAFIDLLDQNRLEDALVLYRGDFLAGFFVANVSPELEQWIDFTRDRLRRRAIDAAWKLADITERGGRASEAAHWARYAVWLAPDDERSIQRLVALLDRQGDRAGAFKAYAEFAQRLRAELGVEPSAESRAMIEAVRARAVSSLSSRPPAEEPAAAVDVEPVVRVEAAPVATIEASGRGASIEMPGLRSTRRGFRRAWYAGAVVGAACLVAATLAVRTRPPYPALPTIAIGWVQDPSGADTASSVRAFAELLATDLARVRGLRIVSHARLHDMLDHLGVREETPSAIAEAARRVGADELLEAVLSRVPSTDRPLRLELRRVDLRTGVARGDFVVDGGTEFELADRGMARLVEEIGLHAPADGVTGVTTTSLPAQRLYEEGLRRFYEGDRQTAVQLFHSALREDSTFAMAAFYAGLGEQSIDARAAYHDLALALRLATRVSERERLIIQQTWAYTTNDPTQLVMAESLAARYPHEPVAELALGRAKAWSGDFLGALPHLRRTIRLDSLGLSGRTAWCRACEALTLMIDAYLSADSVDAAERAAREWTRMQPGSPSAWWALAWVLGREERYDSALAAEQTAERVASGIYDDVVPRVLIAIRSGQFAVADRMLGDQAVVGNPAKRAEALWWLVISLRNQGRLRTALATAERAVWVAQRQRPGRGAGRSLESVGVAQTLFEMGRFREAAALFDSIARGDWRASPEIVREAPGIAARHRLWMTTHIATALAAAGDTGRLAVLVDSLTVWSPQSAYFRDRALQHYARGLLLVARGETASAVGELRRALIAPGEGFSRVNLELGKILLVQGRAREAIPILRAPLHGPMEASNYYLTYTELRAMLGEALELAGEPDSALVQYRRVLAAWSRADPELQPCVQAIERRVHALEHGRPIRRFDRMCARVGG